MVAVFVHNRVFLSYSDAYSKGWCKYGWVHLPKLAHSLGWDLLLGLEEPVGAYVFSLESMGSSLRTFKIVRGSKAAQRFLRSRGWCESRNCQTSSQATWDNLVLSYGVTSDSALLNMRSDSTTTSPLVHKMHSHRWFWRSISTQKIQRLHRHSKQQVSRDDRQLYECLGCFGRDPSSIQWIRLLRYPGEELHTTDWSDPRWFDGDRLGMIRVCGKQ